MTELRQGATRFEDSRMVPHLVAIFEPWGAGTPGIQNSSVEVLWSEVLADVGLSNTIVFLLLVLGLKLF